jgi:hypothetical protein
MCPAYGWRVRLYWLLQRIGWRLRVLAPFGLALALGVLTAAPAAADHNPSHDCPVAIAQAILSGARGGTFYGTTNRVTWTDGVYVCVFQGSQATTFFKSRNATSYLAKDAAKRGAVQVGLDTAKKLAGAAGSNLLGLGLRPSLECWKGYDQRTRQWKTYCPSNQ